MKDFVKQSAFTKLAALEKAEQKVDGRLVTPGSLKPEPEAMKGESRIGQKAASGGRSSLDTLMNVQTKITQNPSGILMKKEPPTAGSDGANGGGRLWRWIQQWRGGAPPSPRPKLAPPLADRR